MSAPLLEVIDLEKTFLLARTRWFAPRPRRHAVAGVSFVVEAGRSFGIVGESGSGKSTVARAVMALLLPTSGEVRLEGRSLFALSRGELKAMRAHFQMIFQDPYGSLDPRQSVARIVAEPLANLAATSGAERARARRRGARRRGPGCRFGAKISARILRRPTPAHRHRARADHAAQARRRGRAGLGARRLDPGAGAQPDERPATRRRRDLSPDQPRSRGRRPHLRGNRGDVPRPLRRDRAFRRPADGARRIPTRANSSTPRPSSGRRRWRAPTRRRAPRRRPAAPMPRGARSRRSDACWRRRRCGRSRADGGSRAIFRWRRQLEAAGWRRSKRLGCSGGGASEILFRFWAIPRGCEEENFPSASPASNSSTMAAGP